MKRFAKIFLFIMPLFFLSAPRCAYSYVERSTAVLRVLNKAAGKTQIIRVPVEKSINFEKLNISVRACKQTDPFDAENSFAFVEIYESGESQIFGGWMNKNEPGQNPLQNPDYDVWLITCE